MIRLRVSTLEDFRRCVETDFGDEQELRDRLIRGQWAEGPTKWQMEAGTAWHALLAGKSNGIKWTFHADDWEKALSHIGPGLREITGRQTFRAAGQVVEIEGTADVIHGLTVQDHKAKFSACDPRDYEDSLQWRFYLAIHGANSFRYNLFDFKDPDDSGYCKLKQIVSFRFWRYPALEGECLAWVERFLEWARATALLSHLHLPRHAA